MEQSTVHPLKTALYEEHVTLQAKMVDFAGYLMPLYYSAIQKEHLAVRENAGLFDVSHMGVVEFSGKEVVEFLEYICTNRVSDKKIKTSFYTVFCDAEGGAIDDALIYRLGPFQFFTIVNASNKEKDLNHFKEIAKDFDVTITSRFKDLAILALQGKQADHCIKELFPLALELENKCFSEFSYQKSAVTVAKTGYTGEFGFEIMAPNSVAQALWCELLEKGAKYHLVPCGLGARDTLRLEKGYALYGHEITETITPLESVCSFAVKMDKDHFLGKEALEKKERRFMAAVKLSNKGPLARQGFAVVDKKGRVMGQVTSGAFSPSLQVPIALILIDKPLKNGDTIDILVREKKIEAEVVTLPFV
jgi:aminomethyltransferase